MGTNFISNGCTSGKKSNPARAGNRRLIPAASAVEERDVLHAHSPHVGEKRLPFRPETAGYRFTSTFAIFS
jgi:hypothetical protein